MHNLALGFADEIVSTWWPSLDIWVVEEAYQRAVANWGSANDNHLYAVVVDYNFLNYASWDVEKEEMALRVQVVLGK